VKILVLVGITLPVFLSGQESGDRLRFAFYNVENLFDPFDDSLTADEEFLPGGIRGWTWQRLDEKLDRIYKVLTALGGWDPPAMIGLCEVENNFVLQRLVAETPLRKHQYRILHDDSPDPRGIDVALLYRPGIFREVVYRYHRVTGHGSSRAPTRDILYVKGSLKGGRDLHVFVNHWPSRWEGTLETRPERLAAAAVLRRLVDSLFLENKQASILVMGDFNDEITDISLRDSLQVRLNEGLPSGGGLFLPFADLGSGTHGSLKYRGRWYGFDLILVSRALLRDPECCVSSDGFRIYSPTFLLEEDPVWLGTRPFRTYLGYRYHGGFSDHLPVYIDLVLQGACWSGIR
jgi:hypothetical protein